MLVLQRKKRSELPRFLFKVRQTWRAEALRRPLQHFDTLSSCRIACKYVMTAAQRLHVPLTRCRRLRAGYSTAARLDDSFNACVGAANTRDSNGVGTGLCTPRQSCSVMLRTDRVSAQKDDRSQRQYSHQGLGDIRCLQYPLWIYLSFRCNRSRSTPRTWRRYQGKDQPGRVWHGLPFPALSFWACPELLHPQWIYPLAWRKQRR